MLPANRRSRIPDPRNLLIAGEETAPSRPELEPGAIIPVVGRRCAGRLPGCQT